MHYSLTVAKPAQQKVGREKFIKLPAHAQRNCQLLCMYSEGQVIQSKSEGYKEISPSFSFESNPVYFKQITPREKEKDNKMLTVL